MITLNILKNRRAHLSLTHRKYSKYHHRRLILNIIELYVAKLVSAFRFSLQNIPRRLAVELFLFVENKPLK